MKNRDNRLEPHSASHGHALRQRAEEIAQEKEVRSACDLQVVSPEETQQQLHELLVHQIELEMQNDELRHAQAELEDARARYIDLYDLAPVGYCTLSENGLILEINLTAASLLGVPRSVLINQPITRFIINEDQDVYYLYKRQLNGAEESQTYELRMARTDGTVFWAHLVANALLDADGERISRVALSDITERKLKDEELKAAKDSLSAEVEALNNLHTISTQFIRQDSLQRIHEEILKAAIAMSHADKGNIQILSENERSLKIFLHSGLGEPFLKYFDHVSYESGTCGKAFQEMKRVIVDDVLMTPIFAQTADLQVMLAEGIKSVQSTPMISSTGNFLGVISTHYKTRHQFNERELRMFDLLARQAADVLERIRIEEALQQSEQHALALVEELQKVDQNKNDFISMLSHEIRNPLAVIMVGISLLDHTIDAKKFEDTKEIMERQSTQLCRLVDDLLDLTRINTNKVKLKKELTELCKMAASVADDYRAQFEDKGVRFETNIIPDTLFLEADTARLTQIIGNLLHNAVKFTETGGAALLTVSKRKNQAVICVEDNGIGIRPEILPEIFLPFVQLDDSIERSNGGLGLGLAIVKGMAELHGGTVSAFSEGLGKGTQFTVLLPLSSEEENKQAKTHPIGRSTSRSFRILLIEDNGDLADILCTALGRSGHEAISARSGADGIVKAKAILPDVIFCDIGLPGMNGYEVARIIRSDDLHKSVFMVALTGYATPKDIELAMNAGFNKHLSKPVDIASLNQILAEVP